MKLQIFIRNLVVNSLILCSLYSCTAVRWVEMERLKPATKDIPSEVRRIAVVNNHIQPPRQTKGKALVWPNVRMVVDSLAANLADAFFFDEVVVLDSPLVSPSKTQYENYQLSPQQVKHLTRILQVDMLVAVELAMFIPKASDELGYYWPEGKVISLVKLYLPKEKTPFDTLTQSTEIYWNRVPTAEELQRDIVDIVATHPVEQIVPCWEKEEFPYYSNGCIEFRDADVCIRENDWESARSIWEKVLSHKQARKRMRANLNMAVWYEVNSDSISQAKFYAQKALDLASKNETFESGRPITPSQDYLLISDYLNNLKRREKEFLRLKGQMQRFEDVF